MSKQGGLVVVSRSYVIAHVDAEQQGAIQLVHVNVLGSGCSVTSTKYRFGIHRVLLGTAPLNDNLVFAVAVKIAHRHVLCGVGAALRRIYRARAGFRVRKFGAGVQFLDVLYELGFQLGVQGIADDAIGPKGIDRLPGFMVVFVESVDP